MGNECSALYDSLLTYGLVSLPVLLLGGVLGGYVYRWAKGGPWRTGA